MPSSGMISLMRAPTLPRRFSCTSCVVKRLSVPTRSRMMIAGSLARIEYRPKAVTRTMPNSLSRMVAGPGVPHFKSVNLRVEMKYTSALNGLLKPYFHPLGVVRMGMFCVVSS